MKATDRKKELAGKSPADLNKELSSLLRAHFNLRMQKGTQQLTNTSQLKRTRREIARVKTLIHQKAQQS